MEVELTYNEHLNLSLQTPPFIDLPSLTAIRVGFHPLVNIPTGDIITLVGGNQIRNQLISQISCLSIG